MITAIIAISPWWVPVVKGAAVALVVIATMD